MVLIAIDKYSRKILGYLCKNDQIVAYCCGECDVEFTGSAALEEHMVTHEKPSTDHHHEPSIANDHEENQSFFSLEDSRDGVAVVQQQLSESEKENLLMQKYQVTPCSVQLHRYSEEEYKQKQNEVNEKTAASEEMVPSEPNALEPENLTEEQPMLNPLESVDTNETETVESQEVSAATESIPSAQPSNASDEMATAAETVSTVPATVSTVPVFPSPVKKGRPKKRIDPNPPAEAVSPKKRRRVPTQKAIASKKMAKAKLPPSVCFLCGRQFATSIQLAQHQKIHLSTTDSLVFPCSVCGKKVSNLKNHMRQHKKDDKKNGINETSSKVAVRKSAPKSKVKKEEASSSTDAVFTKAISQPELEHATSNEALHTSNSNASPQIYYEVAAVVEVSTNNVTPLPPPTISTFTIANICDEILPTLNADLFDQNVLSQYEEVEVPLEFIDQHPIQMNEPSQSTPALELLEQDFDIDDTNDIETEDDSTMQTMDDDVEPPAEAIEAAPIRYVAPYKCDGCSRRFDTPKILARHRKKHDKKTNCKICGKRLASSYVKVHIKNHHSNHDANIPSNGPITT